MNTCVPVRRLVVCALLANLLLRSYTKADATQPAGREVRLTLSELPSEQWKTISIDIEPIADGDGAEASALTDIELVITAPSGSHLVVSTFQIPSDDTHGRQTCRFTPREVGNYTAKINSASERAPRANILSFQVSRSRNGRGFLSLDRSQPYYMSFDDGQQFRGIGTNIAWEPRRRRSKEYTYNALFPRISAYGLNTVRTWICPWNMPLEWNTKQLGVYDQNSLSRLDEMFALAQQNGLYIVLVLGYHGELQTVSGSFPNNDRWRENPYNVINGGPCETPADFFTNESAKALYKKRLRMLVARVACHLHLLAWEFWNEVDHIQRRGPVPGEAIVAWHKEMSEYLDSIDPYDHPITTSVSVEAPTGLWETDDLDLIMLHPYGSTDRLVSMLMKTNAKFGKPAVAGEFSHSWKPPESGEEKNFERELKLGLWRGLMSPTPALPMTWWWEFHDARRDWRYIRPVAEFSHRMTALNVREWKPIQPEIANDAVECHGIIVGSGIYLWLHNRTERTASNVKVEIREAADVDYELMQFSTLTGELIDEDGASLHATSGILNLFISALPAGHDTSFILSRDEGASRP